MLLEVAGEKIKVEQRKILYVAVDGHYTTVYCEEQSLTIKESFSEVLNRLNKDVREGEIPFFVKCHRSAAVNLSKVLRIGRQSCVLSGEVEVPVSRGMYQQLNQAFIQKNL
ncbi:protein containing LytTr DNA-binding region domain protein [gut metagenome]|uniref:Protein containing LytTr DNA-binding region domain protein n=1 Tax=gut metagenome TaxID=749906 RepID=J9GLB1_9ZZZZ